jgi:hypothetical protein
MKQKILDFYKQPLAITSTDEYATSIKKLPNDIKSLVKIVQGLAIHEFVASEYNFEVPEERKGEAHIRYVQQMFKQLFKHDVHPLSTARPPEKRLVGVCHHFMLFLTSLLRAKGYSVRARCGFGTYFNPGTFEDHWVCEYWNEEEARWILVDAQMDEVQHKVLHLDFDNLDVPRNRFIIAGDAWMQCRNGNADPSKFGIFKGNLRGLWFIAGDIVRDVASLNKMEMLPWDTWGGMPKPGDILNGEELQFFDHLAKLTLEPDTSFDELRKAYRNDDRLHVPKKVFNAQLQRMEAVSPN